MFVPGQVGGALKEALHATRSVHNCESRHHAQSDNRRQLSQLALIEQSEVDIEKTERK